MKYLLAFLVLLIALSQLWRKGRAWLRGGMANAGSRPTRPHAQAMVPCHVCGVHIPQSEAFYRNSRAYCCAAHAQQARP